MPTFYDKLLQVPLLNLSIQGIDWAARSRFLCWLDPWLWADGSRPAGRNVAYMSIWTLVFIVLSATGAVGDNHPGQWLPFWRQACQDGRSVRLPLRGRRGIGFL